MKPANSILSSYGTTVFEVMSRLAIEHEAVNLGQGFPDFPMPDFVKQAAVEAIMQDYNQYSRPAGHKRLVELLAERYSPRLGQTLDPLSEIAVVGGATNVLHACRVLCPRLDERRVPVRPLRRACRVPSVRTVLCCRRSFRRSWRW